MAIRPIIAALAVAVGLSGLLFGVLYYLASREGGGGSSKPVISSFPADIVSQPAVQTEGAGWRLQADEAQFDINAAVVLMDEASAAPQSTISVMASDLQRVIMRLTVGRVPFATLRRSEHQLIVSDQEPSEIGYRLLIFDLDTASLVKELPISPQRLNKSAYGNAMTSSPDGRYLYYTSVDLPSPVPSGCTSMARPAQLCDAFTLHVLDLRDYAEITRIALPVNCGFTKFTWLPTAELSVSCPEIGVFVGVGADLYTSQLGEFRDVEANSVNDPVAYWRIKESAFVLYSDGTLVETPSGTVAQLLPLGDQRINGVAFVDNFVLATFGDRKSSTIDGYFSFDAASGQAKSSKAPANTYAMQSLPDGRALLFSHGAAGDIVTILDIAAGSSMNFLLEFAGEVTDVVS